MTGVGRRIWRGFTVVELMVVIVIIAILAAISIGAYRGSQGRARDSTRQNSLAEIRSALESYRAEHGTFPVPAGGTGTWETSNTSPSTFLSALQPYMGTVPVDPINDATHNFYYSRYTAGTSAAGMTCAASRGDYYVLGGVGFETVTGSSVSPGWNCDNGSSVPTDSHWVSSTTQATWGGFAL